MDRFNRIQRFWGVVVLGVIWGTVTVICSLRSIKSVLVFQPGQEVSVNLPLFLASIMFLICLLNERLRKVGFTISLWMIASGSGLFILSLVLALGLGIKIPDLVSVSVSLLIPGILNGFFYNSALAGNQAFQKWKEQMFP
jgi:hypothetical protein